MLVYVFSMQYYYSPLLYANPVRKITSADVFDQSGDSDRLLDA
jgi:hypothetical protein